MHVGHMYIGALIALIICLLLCSFLIMFLYREFKWIV